MTELISERGLKDATASKRRKHNKKSGAQGAAFPKI
jgi:hypothetical protein